MEYPHGFSREFSHVLAPLTAIFNSSMREGVVPTMWKTADVIPIPQNHPPRSVQSDIRPISLTPIATKAFEAIVLGLIV